MSNHETIRGWLALSAAGLLECGEERQVREHAEQCAACAAELEMYAALSAGLREMPAPHPPEHLVARTSALMAMEADRRQASLLAGGSAVFAFAFVAIVAQVLRIVTGDQVAMVWLMWVLVSSVFGAASALTIATARRRFQRSTL